MLLEILPTGPLQCNCSIFGDAESGRALVFDPGDDIPKIQEILERHGLTVETIVFTHAHIDHIGAGAEFKRLTGAPTYLHREELPVLASLPQQASWLGVPPPEQVEIDHFLEEGDTVEFAGRPFEVLFTPGHSPGSISLYSPGDKLIVSGDVLFRDSIGRTDLPGGDFETLMSSIRDKLYPLDDGVTVIPGHGPTTTIGRERRRNPFLAQLRESA
jgi:glyoxylase-like metal-dependent hydrolase (beta-lactamase superfamily II)